MFNFSKSNFTTNDLPTSQIHYYALFLEMSFPEKAIADFITNYWSITIPIVLGYVIAIRVGLKYMQDRPKYNLRNTLFLWNAVLTFIYVFGLYRVLPEFLYNVRQGDLYSFACLQCPFGCTKVSRFYVFVFAFLKFPELLDTAFVILRKQPLFFLHWYHHCTVLVITWFLYSSYSSAGLVFALVNTVVHALMYFYYALKSLSVRVPRPVSMALTLIQLSQMAVGLYTVYFVYQTKKMGRPCSVSETDNYFTLFIYSSYFLLFTWYFYQAYIAKNTLIIAKFKGQKIL